MLGSDAVIVDAVRSPMARGKAPKDGKPGGALSGVHPVELLGQTVKALLERNPALDPGDVEDFIVGCVSQVGEQAGCPVAGRGSRRACPSTCRPRRSTAGAGRASRPRTSPRRA